MLCLLAEGKTNQEIAATLFISVKTVETYRSRMMQKLGLRDFATPDQVGLSPRLNHLQFLVADVFVLQLLDLDMNGVRHLVRSVAGEGKCVEGKKMGILVAG